MARSGKKYLKISKGQISSRLIERTDIGILDDSGQEITNFYNTKYGALQTVTGTRFVHNFGKNVKVRIVNIKLSNNLDGFMCFDDSNKKLLLFNHEAILLDQINFNYVTEQNYKKLSIAQNENLILLCTTDNPLIQIKIDANKLSYNIYSIHAKNIMKVGNVSRDTDNSSAANIYRTKEIINTIDEAQQILSKLGSDWPIGTMVQANQSNDRPDINFPWSVYVKKENGDWGKTSYSPHPTGDIFFSQKSPGEFSFTVPEDMTIQIKASAGGGGLHSGLIPSYIGANRGYSSYNAELYQQTYLVNNGDIISGIIGTGGITATLNDDNGGPGYHTGASGQSDGSSRGGGGGGSTSIKINGALVYEVSGGKGVSFSPTIIGGNGAGPLGHVTNHTGSKGGYCIIPLPSGQWIPKTQYTKPENGFIEISRAPSTLTNPVVQNLWNNQVYL